MLCRNAVIWIVIILKLGRMTFYLYVLKVVIIRNAHIALVNVKAHVQVNAKAVLITMNASVVSLAISYFTLSALLNALKGIKVKLSPD